MSGRVTSRRRWLILGVLMSSFLLTVLDGTIINVAFKVLADPVVGLGASPGELQWVVNAFTLVYAGLLLAWGVIADRVGHKRILLVGLAVFGVASVFAALSSSPGELVAWRTVMGLGAAAIPPTTLATISHVFDDEERPKAIGLWVSAAGIAAVIAPVVGGLLLQYFWWGSIFIINGPIVVVAFVLTLLLVPESRNAVARRVDAVGILLSVGWSVLLVFGIIQAGTLATFADPLAFGPVLAGLVLLAVFVVWELRSDHPALDVRVFRDRGVSAAAVAVAVIFFVNFGAPFFLVFYLQSVQGRSTLVTGLTILPIAVAIMVFAPRSAALVRRFGGRLVVLGGLTLVTLACVIFAVLSVGSDLWLLLLANLLVGMGVAHVMPTSTSMIMQGVPRESAGAGSALTNLCRSIGGAIGLAVLGSLLTLVYRTSVTPGLTGLGDQQRTLAAESIEGARSVATSLGGAPGDRLLDTGTNSFMTAMHLTSWTCVALLVVTIAVVGVTAPRSRPVPAPAGSR